MTDTAAIPLFLGFSSGEMKSRGIYFLTKFGLRRTGVAESFVARASRDAGGKNAPRYQGISADGFAVFTQGEVAEGESVMDGDKIVMSLTQVRRSISNAGIVGQHLGKSYRRVMLREFGKARKDLATGAKPTLPAVKGGVAGGVTPDPV